MYGTPSHDLFVILMQFNFFRTSNGVPITTRYALTAIAAQSINTITPIDGGFAAIDVLGLLLFCFRRRRSTDEFDANFDPDPEVDTLQEGGHSRGSICMIGYTIRVRRPWAWRVAQRQYSAVWGQPVLRHRPRERYRPSPRTS